MATIQENLNTLSEIKTDIKTAIINKGVDAGDDITVYGDKIREISSGEVDNTDYLCFEAIESSSVQLLQRKGDYEPNVECSYDKQNWFTIHTNDIVSIAPETKLYVRGDNPNGFSPNGTATSNEPYRNNLKTSGKCSLSGNIMTIIQKDGNTNIIPCNYCFRLLFWESLGIVDTINLKLPSVSLKLECYSGMFQSCKNLKYPVKELPSTTLIDACYANMYLECTALIETPYLPAKKLVNKCYNGMFSNCSSLQYIKAEFTTSPSSTYSLEWVKSVASTGCFIKAKDATWTGKATYACPSGWTLITSVS